MFVIESARYNYFKSQKDKEILDKAIPLIKEVFGYTDKEIEKFKEKLFFPPLALDVTLEQAKLAIQPFWDANISIYANEYDDNTLELIDHVSCIKRLKIIEQSPKTHYYDQPIIKREQLVDPYNPPTWNTAWTTGYTFVTETKPTNVPKCPTCQSTNIQKLSTTSKVLGVGLLGLASKTVGKTYKCKNCGCYW